MRAMRGCASWASAPCVNVKAGRGNQTKLKQFLSFTKNQGIYFFEQKSKFKFYLCEKFQKVFLARLGPPLAAPRLAIWHLEGGGGGGYIKKSWWQAGPGTKIRRYEFHVMPGLRPCVQKKESTKPKHKIQANKNGGLNKFIALTNKI